MGMNVRGIVRSGINSINPDVSIVIVRIQGFTVGAGREQIPNKLTPEGTDAQIQPLKTSDLEHVNNYNSSKTYKYLHIDGDWNSLRRADEKGGDLIYFDGFEWMINAIPEKYRGQWTRVIVVLQKVLEAPAVPE